MNTEQRIVVLSGQVSVGKTTLVKQLVNKYDAIHCKTSELILNLKPNVALERNAMQKAGESLDRSTKGEWIAHGIREIVETNDKSSLFIVDSVRIKNQIDCLRRAYGSKVFHIHLTASKKILADRYKGRKNAGIKELNNYKAVLENPTERNVHNLEKFADAVINTELSTVDDVLVRAAAHLGLFQRTVNSLVDVIVGGQYGSEGKGNIADHISPEYDILVRTGGPNAGHKVFKKPAPLVYRHIPSGAFNAPNAKLILGPGAVINVETLMEEIADNKVTVDQLFIDPQATIITSQDIKKETKLSKIASTQKGVGAAMASRIMNRSSSTYKLAKDIKLLKPYIEKSADILEDAYKNHRKILIEGTQGTGLSLFHGQYPHVTSRDTTVSAFLAEIGMSPRRVRKVILVVRTYPIRVGGSSGPMSNELEYEDLSKRSGIPLEDLINTEKATVSGSQRRIGEFDWKQLHEACVLNGPTDIAITFIDYLGVVNRKARRFEQLNEDAIRFIEEVERVSGVGVSLISTRFDYRNIIDRRAW